MTEAEWLAAPTSPAMLRYLNDQVSARKRRLTQCACCRRFWCVLDERSRRTIEVAERDADGLASPGEVERARREAAAACQDVYQHFFGYAEQRGGFEWLVGGERHRVPGGFFGGPVSAACRVQELLSGGCGGPSFADTSWIATAAYPLPCPGRDVGNPKVDAELAAQAVLLRCLFGNPFRPVTVEPAWLAWNDGAARRLAQAAYDDRQLPSGTLDHSRLAVLADALEDAGCTDRILLDHLRGPGSHVRGCWAVDALLGKT